MTVLGSKFDPQTMRLSGLTPDPQDSRDYIYIPDLTDILPESVDLRPYCSNMEDQLSVGSCTANATCSNAEMFLKAGGKFADMSRLFNYFTSRSYLSADMQQSDKGSVQRFALRAAKNFGIAREEIWPYSPTQTNTTPTPGVYDDAKAYLADSYCRIKTNDVNITQTIKHALASGYPVLVGMMVGEKIKTLTKDEIYSFVHHAINPPWGGHEMLIVGYNKESFTVQNSWGSGWCDGGFFKCVQGVMSCDVVDLWIMKGFAGVQAVGPDLTKKAEPPPPVEPPAPPVEPVPPVEPPAPPAPPVDPPKKEWYKEKRAIIAGAVIAGGIIGLAIYWYIR